MYQAKVVAMMETEAQAHWADKYHLALEDRPFKPTDQQTIFTRHSVVFGDGESTALGTGHYRYPGIQYLSIFFQAASGNASVYEYADRIVRFYTDKILTDDGLSINFQVASTVKLPKDVTGYSQLQVICPFYFDSRS